MDGHRSQESNGSCNKTTWRFADSKSFSAPIFFISVEGTLVVGAFVSEI